MLQEVATVLCTDMASADEAVIIVRTGRAQVALCVSLMGSSDTEVVLAVEDAVRTRDALSAAIERAGRITE